MNTWTLNRNVDTDCLFVALNDTCFADFNESQNLDWNDVRAEKESFLGNLISSLAKMF